MGSMEKVKLPEGEKILINGKVLSPSSKCIVKEETSNETKQYEMVIVTVFLISFWFPSFISLKFHAFLKIFFVICLSLEEMIFSSNFSK